MERQAQFLKTEGNQVKVPSEYYMNSDKNNWREESFKSMTRDLSAECHDWRGVEQQLGQDGTASDTGKEMEARNELNDNFA